MAITPVTASDRMSIRHKLLMTLGLSALAVQTATLFQVLDQDGDDGESDSEDSAMDMLSAWSNMLGTASSLLLISAARTLTRRGVTYAVGPERYSFDRIQREFGTTASCKSIFRFELQHLRLLCDELRFPSIIRTHNATATGEEAFLYMLRRLSYPSTQSRLAWESGRSPAAQSELFDAAITHVYEEFAHLRDHRSLECWGPHFERFAAIIKAGGRKGPVPLNNCVGYVDGSNQKMDKPKVGQHVLYNGHKRCHVVKWQGIMLPNGIMPMPFGPCHGRNHDAHMLHLSKLPRIMRRICRRLGLVYQIYGDPAYPQSQYIGGPFRHTRLNDAEALFNVRMSSTRISNEWGFGKILTNWAYLDFRKGMKPYLNDIQKYWPVAQILTNCHTCLYGSQVTEYFNCGAPDVSDYLNNAV